MAETKILFLKISTYLLGICFICIFVSTEIDRRLEVASEQYLKLRGNDRIKRSIPDEQEQELNRLNGVTDFTIEAIAKLNCTLNYLLATLESKRVLHQADVVKVHSKPCKGKLSNDFTSTLYLELKNNVNQHNEKLIEFDNNLRTTLKEVENNFEQKLQTFNESKESIETAISNELRTQRTFFKQRLNETEQGQHEARNILNKLKSELSLQGNIIKNSIKEAEKQYSTNFNKSKQIEQEILKLDNKLQTVDNKIENQTNNVDKLLQRVERNENSISTSTQEQEKFKGMYNSLQTKIKNDRKEQNSELNRLYEILIAKIKYLVNDTSLETNYNYTSKLQKMRNDIIKLEETDSEASNRLFNFVLTLNNNVFPILATFHNFNKQGTKTWGCYFDTCKGVELKRDDLVAYFIMEQPDHIIYNNVITTKYKLTDKRNDVLLLWNMEVFKAWSAISTNHLTFQGSQEYTAEDFQNGADLSVLSKERKLEINFFPLSDGKFSNLCDYKLEMFNYNTKEWNTVGVKSCNNRFAFSTDELTHFIDNLSVHLRFTVMRKK